ncbi:DUF6192 family protein [Streptomyces tauricus]|uniref:DUF6192 family protein n=1 Tax=Streptomyces tauricus TaxID=68274 RepID=UPI00382C001B
MEIVGPGKLRTKACPVTDLGVGRAWSAAVAIHGLATDDRVAARVASDLLQRPAVAGNVPAKARIEAIGGLAHDEQVAAEAARRLLHRPDVVQGDGGRPCGALAQGRVVNVFAGHARELKDSRPRATELVGTGSRPRQLVPKELRCPIIVSCRLR